MAKKTAHEQILDELNKAGAKLPVKIILPPALFKEFEEDIKGTTFGMTVWGVPVESGDVKKIKLVMKD